LSKFLVRFVEFEVFSKLFEQLQDLISSFVFDCSQEQRSQQIIVDLNLLRFRCQHYKAFGILLKSLASFQKQNKAFKSGGID